MLPSLLATFSLGLERGRTYVVRVSAYNGVSHLAHPSESGMVQALILFGSYYILLYRGWGDLREDWAKERLGEEGRNGGECMHVHANLEGGRRGGKGIEGARWRRVKGNLIITSRTCANCTTVPPL